MQTKSPSLTDLTATQKSLFPFGTFAIFDDGLITLTMRANDGDQCHKGLYVH